MQTPIRPSSANSASSRRLGKQASALQRPSSANTASSRRSSSQAEIETAASSVPRVDGDFRKVRAVREHMLGMSSIHLNLFSSGGVEYLFRISSKKALQTAPRWKPLPEPIATSINNAPPERPATVISLNTSPTARSSTPPISRR